MQQLKRRLKWSRRGVSEIIGNILILGITVTLFSSIMWYVVSMPPPQENAYADFSSQVYINTQVIPAQVQINITHKGGQELKNSSSALYLEFNSKPYVLRISDSSPSIGSTWVTGETWRYGFDILLGEDPHGPMSIMIVDTVRNTVVWTATLSGGAVGGGVKPIIGARGTTPIPSYAGDPLWFYVTVTDPDGDLNRNSVYVDLASIGLPSSVKMADSNNDNVFTVGPYTSLIDWNGKIVVFNATDLNGHMEVGRLTLSIQLKPGGGNGNNYGPYINYSHYLVNGTYPPDASGGEAGSSIGTTFYYIRRYSDNVITRDFVVGERVLVEVYSDALVNLALENAFYIFHPITGEAISPQTKLIDAFQYGGIYGTFHCYVYNFSAPSDSYTYPLQMKMKDSTGTTINLADTISVGGVNYPKLETYKLVSGGLVKTSNFDHTDTVYLRIVTKDVDRLSSTVYLSDLEISDYTGRYIVKKVPPSYASPPAYSAPISSLYKTSGTSPTPGYENTNNGVYTVYIVLKDAYQGWWLPKKNAYTMKILMITDSGSGGSTPEVYNLLNMQINVTAPLSTTDLIATVGSGSFTWSASGATWTNNKVSWYSGGEQWDETVIDGSPNAGCIGIALADLSGNGRNDVVIGSQDSTYANLLWYENQKPDGSQWSSGRPIAMPFDAIAGTQAANNNDKGNANEDSSVFSTQDGNRFQTAYTCNMELVGAIAVGDFDHDGDGDVVASFIHVVVYSTATSEADARANPGKNQGMYFNRGIYVYWNDGLWTRTTLYSTDTWIANNEANKDTNPAAMDLAVGDFDRDNYPDIVAVYETGATKVWLNQWGKITGDATAHRNGAFALASYRNLPALPAADSTLPWDHVQYVPRVRVADMNLDQYPDIIRTNTKSKSVSILYTIPGVPDEIINTPQYEYPAAGSTTPSRTGSMANLANADASYEVLRETYLNYTPTTVIPSLQSVGDTTLEPLNQLKYNDSNDYKVDTGVKNTLWITYWDVDSFYSGRVAAEVKVIAKFSVDSGYVGNNKLQWSYDGLTFYDTTIQPTGSDTSYVYRTFILPKAVDTYSEVQSLDFRFVNNDGTTHKVKFDFLNLQVTFVQTREMGWVWQIPNQNRAFHNMTFVGHRSGTTAETFRLAYSVDNTTWFNLTDINAITDVTLQFDLTYTPSAYYWVRVVDLIRDTSDVFNDTLYVDKLTIRHFALTVSWDLAHTSKIWTGPDYLNAIAVGDVGKIGGDYKADGIPDIVVATARVGSGFDTKTLYILTQGSIGSFSAQAVYTTQMSVLCSNSAQYDTKAVELGDNDGDGDLDIVVVVGAPPGVTPGAGPTMWSYMNNQQFASGVWQFGEGYVNVLASKGESAINVKEGNIDLSIFLPFLGVLGVVVAEAVVNRKGKRE